MIIFIIFIKMFEKIIGSCMSIYLDIAANLKTYIVSWVSGMFSFFFPPKMILNVSVEFNVVENLVRMFWAVSTAIVILIISFFVKMLLSKLFRKENKV